MLSDVERRRSGGAGCHVLNDSGKADSLVRWQSHRAKLNRCFSVRLTVGANIENEIKYRRIASECFIAPRCTRGDRPLKFKFLGLDPARDDP